MEQVTKELLERIVKLETSVMVREEERKGALVLARDLLAKEIELIRVQTAEKLEVHNQWQKRWDRNEATLATKQEVLDGIRVSDDKTYVRISYLEKLVWAGIGIMLAVQFYFRYLKG